MLLTRMPQLQGLEAGRIQRGCIALRHGEQIGPGAQTRLRQRLQERIHPEQSRKQQDTAIAILNVGGMNEGVQQQAERVYQNVALLALDLLARIIAMRIDAGPPFSALFTLWLSMMAAVGLASRSACSRQST